MNKLAFVFPGQGSQKVGMLFDLAKEYSVIASTFSEASEALNYNLWDMVSSGPQALLNLTEHTQPILLTASVAIYRAWREQGGAVPVLMAGHSLGEWSALVCSEVVSFADAVKATERRGRYMQEAVPKGEGSMAAVIGLTDKDIIDVCQQAAQGQAVSAVNFNSPGQVVIAGNTAAVDRACKLCKEKGAKRIMPLAVSAPFHSSLLKPAAEKLRGYLEGVNFNPPRTPIIHNVHAQTESDPSVIKQRMIEQVDHPVLWTDCINALAKAGINTLVECGPGKVLCGLAKRIDKSLTAMPVEAPVDFQMALAFDY
ncbi:MAG: [acyl-carrier-protein] S-malonyltransferase [Cellvibrionaceae bacterium]|jgi:[acyl-carrier-protein] S-malonyltransferase